MNTVPVHDVRDVRDLGRHLRVTGVRREQDLVAKIPATLRWLRRLRIVLAVAVPVLVIGLLAVLWHWAS